MNAFLRELISGVRMHATAFRFIHQQKLYLWLLLPIAINVALFVSTFGLSSYFSDALTQWLTAWMGSEDSLWQKVLYWTIFLGSRLLVFFAYALFYKNLVFIVLSPLLAFLSEKTDEKATGNSYPFSWSQLLKDVIRGVRLAVRNLLYELGLSLVLLAFGFVPLVGWISPILLLMVQSYFYGFSMLDYNCERYKMNTTESLRFVRTHRGLAIGLGLSFYGLFLLPYVGWIIAPVWGIVAATLAFLQIKKARNLKASGFETAS